MKNITKDANEEMYRSGMGEGAQNVHALFVWTTFQEPPGVQLSGSSPNFVLLRFYEDFIA